MGDHLLVSVHLTADRYHGSGDWPPSPARLFQALVSGVARGGALASDDVHALRWLEERGAPLIAVPHKHDGEPVLLYVPNNDLDAVGNDPRRVAELRVGKLVEPRLLTPGVPLLYVWPFVAGDESATRVATLTTIAERLYQLGRGVDMAWARAEVVDEAALGARFAAYPGVVHRPTPGGDARLSLACPLPNSLTSLQTRFAALTRRFTWQGEGKKGSLLFTQPPKARFVTVSYDSPYTSDVFELRDATDPKAFHAWPLDQVHGLIIALRDRMGQRLESAFPNLRSEIEQVVIGRSDEGPPLQRVRLVPLPSIGHEHVDQAIRRVVVQVPSDGVFLPEDVRWSLSGEHIEGRLIVSSDDDAMLDHYGIRAREGYRAWQSVTPLALPAARRRIEPTRQRAEAKGGGERSDEEAAARAAVAAALRHAGLREQLVSVRVQREPFDRKGSRAEPFATDTRFEKERLWHVALEVARPIVGPLVLGDGRYLGLGVMAPRRDATRAEGLWTFEVVAGLTAKPDPEALARALRRAVMARAQACLPEGTALPPFFSGHEPDGAPARHGHEHLAFGFDPTTSRLWIMAPHRLARRAAQGDEWQWLDVLRAAVDGLRVLRAGAAGLLDLRSIGVDPDDPWLRRARIWESATPYVVTRHSKAGAQMALVEDVRGECERLGLPGVMVEVLDARGVSGVGLVGRLRLTFKRWVDGPIVLGRTRHLGGGAFHAPQR